MEKLKWGCVSKNDVKRGKSSYFFKIREDILEDEKCLNTLQVHGVSREEMEKALMKERIFEVSPPISKVDINCS